MRYSLNAYVLALALRGAKTVLVEGQSDVAILRRLFLRVHQEFGRGPKIILDQAGLLQDDGLLKGLGNKQKVLAVAANALTMSLTFNWLVDREWEEMDVDSIPPKLFSLTQTGHGFRTKGHSVENYWFCRESYLDYLRRNHGDYLPIEFFDEFSAKFDDILRFALAVSLVARGSSCIEKCIGLMGADVIAWDGNRFSLSDAFDTALANRGATVMFSDQVNAKETALVGSCAESESYSWMCHGHLGEEVVRACSAHIARAHLPAESSLISSIERGNKAAKFSHDADFVSSLDRSRLEPLWSIVEWAA